MAALVAINEGKKMSEIEKQYMDLSKLDSADSMFFMEALMEMIMTTRMLVSGDTSEEEALAAAIDYETTLDGIFERCMVFPH